MSPFTVSLFILRLSHMEDGLFPSYSFVPSSASSIFRARAKERNMYLVKYRILFTLIKLRRFNLFGFRCRYYFFHYRSLLFQNFRSFDFSFPKFSSSFRLCKNQCANQSGNCALCVARNIVGIYFASSYIHVSNTSQFFPDKELFLFFFFNPENLVIYANTSHKAVCVLARFE